jgi:hypothetical protein
MDGGFMDDLSDGEEEEEEDGHGLGEGDEWERDESEGEEDLGEEYSYPDEGNFMW